MRAVTQTVPNIPETPGVVPSRVGSGDIEYGSCEAKSLFKRLVGLGVILSIEGDGLAIDAPTGVLSSELVGLVRAHRDELLALVGSAGAIDSVPEPEQVAEAVALGPGWLCPWCRLSDRLLPAEETGLRCGRCDRLAWRFVGDSIERCDWSADSLVEAIEPPRSHLQSVAPEMPEKRPARIDSPERSLFGPTCRAGIVQSFVSRRIRPVKIDSLLLMVVDVIVIRSRLGRRPEKRRSPAACRVFV